MNDPKTQAKFDALLAQAVATSERIKAAEKAKALAPKQRIVTVRAEVGRLYYATIRNLVKEARHCGYDVTLEEGEGWLSRPMWIRGPEIAVDAIGSTVRSLRDDS